ncbi:MAG: DUF2924 domain-containing protein [Alphaproteobacteria bacterium]|nr:DUF2924 domain-containing protein [Alphaproteobacteria bacterium]
MVFYLNGGVENQSAVSAVAKEISGLKVSGPKFFGLNNKTA